MIKNKGLNQGNIEQKCVKRALLGGQISRRQMDRTGVGEKAMGQRMGCCSRFPERAKEQVFVCQVVDLRFVGGEWGDVQSLDQDDVNKSVLNKFQFLALSLHSWVPYSLKFGQKPYINFCQFGLKYGFLKTSSLNSEGVALLSNNQRQLLYCCTFQALWL